MEDKDIHASLSGVFTLSKIEAERCSPPVREYSSTPKKKILTYYGMQQPQIYLPTVIPAQKPEVT
jgi:hypothetical protein